MNKYRKMSIAICIFVTLTMVGCGQAKVPEAVDTTSIAIAGDGGVTSYLVEEFDKDYYSISELTAMAITEAADYNTENQKGESIPIVVDKVEMAKDGSQRVVLTHKYNSVDSFADYNGSVLFYGTVQEAVDAGYDLGQSLYSVKDGTILSEEQLLAEADKHVVITGEQALIYCPEKVTYISKGASLQEDGSVDTTQANDIVVILLKK